MSREDLRVDLAVVGAGSGGLSVAAGAAQLGLSVVLFERGEMGGDCLNTGCVPSKALLAVGRRAQAFRSGTRFGLASAEPSVDWAAVRRYVRSVIDTIAPVDSQERFEGLGVRVVREHAKFADRSTLVSDSVSVRAARIVLATGGAPVIPSIPGLAATPYYTNETIFDAAELPSHLIILGGGPIGAELGQAFKRLGAAVTIIDSGAILKRFDEEARALVLGALRDEGVALREGATVSTVSGAEGAIVVELDTGERLTGSHLLVAAGRRAVTEGLDLDRGGVALNDRGVAVRPNLRSVSNPRVWAVGDVAGREQLTHAAGWHASVFVRNAFFKAAAAADSSPMPAAVYTDPEIAAVGLSESEARERFGDRQKAVTWHFADNDRAQADGDPRGFLKLFVGPKARILGAVAAGEGAADHLQMITFAMSARMSLRALTGYVAAYPTRGEIVKRTAGLYYTPVLFSPFTRSLIALLKHIP